MATGKELAIQVERLDRLIYEVRGQKVMLDADLAAVYGVETGALNRAMKRNQERFPEDFVFRLTAEEFDFLRCQIGISNVKAQFATSQRRGGRRYLPYVFTEHGALMAANVLNSPEAVRMSVFVVRAFVQMRDLLGGTKELARQLADLEKKLTARLDVHESVIVNVLRRVMEILDPPPLPPEPPRRRIGFHVEPKDESGSKAKKKA